MNRFFFLVFFLSLLSLSRNRIGNCFLSFSRHREILGVVADSAGREEEEREKERIKKRTKNSLVSSLLCTEEKDPKRFEKEKEEVREAADQAD